MFTYWQWICLTVDCHSFNTETLTTVDNPACYLSTIGNKDLFKHLKIYKDYQKIMLQNQDLKL